MIALRLFEVVRFGPGVIKSLKTVGFITTRSVSFEVALFTTGGDPQGENRGIHHNPKCQQGIYGNTA